MYHVSGVRGMVYNPTEKNFMYGLTNAYQFVTGVGNPPFFKFRLIVSVGWIKICLFQGHQPFKKITIGQVCGSVRERVQLKTAERKNSEELAAPPLLYFSASAGFLLTPLTHYQHVSWRNTLESDLQLLLKLLDNTKRKKQLQRRGLAGATCWLYGCSVATCWL